MIGRIIKYRFSKIKEFSILFIAFVFAFIIFFGIAIVYAWTEPAQAPPSGNISAPVNVGVTSQYKSGALGVGGVFHGYSTGIFDSNVGIGKSSPIYQLDVVGDVAWSGTLQKGSVPWSRLISFPSACPSGQYVTAVGSSLICSTSATSSASYAFPVIVQPSSFTSLNEDQTHNQINQGWITHQILMTKHIGTKLKFKLHLVGDYDQHLKVRLCYGATVTNENVPEFALTTANCGTEIKNIGGAWTSTNRSPVSREGEANLTVPDNQYKYITLQTSIDGGNYYWGWLHYLIEE